MFDNDYANEKDFLLEKYKELSERQNELYNDVISQIAKFDNEKATKLLKFLLSKLE